MRVLVALLLALVAGCGVPPVPVQVPATAPAAPPLPASVSVPDIGVSSTLIDLRLDEQGRLEVPRVDQPEQAGWYALGVRPGAPGPAIIAGHVNGRRDGRSLPGIFARLGELQPGALVHVDRVDGSRVTYRITRVQSYPKDRFPTIEVYGDTALPEIRLITCGGEFDPSARSYLSNVVAYGIHVPTEEGSSA